MYLLLIVGLDLMCEILCGIYTSNVHLSLFYIAPHHPKPNPYKPGTHKRLLAIPVTKEPSPMANIEKK